MSLGNYFRIARQFLLTREIDVIWRCFCGLPDLVLVPRSSLAKKSLDENWWGQLLIGSLRPESAFRVGQFSIQAQTQWRAMWKHQFIIPDLNFSEWNQSKKVLLQRDLVRPGQISLTFLLVTKSWQICSEKMTKFGEKSDKSYEFWSLFGNPGLLVGKKKFSLRENW